MRNFCYLNSIFLFLFLLQGFTVSLNTVSEKVPVKESKIIWKGYKFAGSHEGTLDLKSGFLLFEDNQISGGTFIIDMTSINCTDLSDKKKEKLEAQISADSFFGIKNYPTASLTIINVVPKENDTYLITADLTIKNHTKSIDFESIVKSPKASAYLKIDRTAFDVEFKASGLFDGLKNAVVYNEFDLNIEVMF